MTSAETNRAALRRMLPDVPAPGPACVVTTSEVVRGRLVLSEDRLLPEHDSFPEQRFELTETAETLHLPVEVRVFEEVAISKVQATRTHVETAVLRREVADVSGLGTDPDALAG